MKISIIIPCYNIETHLPKCIDSVLRQTFTDFELLLINDGSTDGTLEVCKEYKNKDSRIKVYSHKNRGVSYTRNRGIDLAQGDYIMFVDGDDFVKKDIIEQFMPHLKKDSWPMCGMLLVKNGVEEERVLYKEMLKSIPYNKVSSNEIFKVITYHNLSTPCCRLYDIKILKDKHIKFKEDISYQEDLIFNLEYSKFIKEIILLDYYGYYYVQHQLSSSSQYHKNFSHIDLLFKLLKDIPQNIQERNYAKKIILDTVLKKVINEFHPKSNTSLAKKRDILKNIFYSEYFAFSNDYTSSLTIHPVFRFLLKSKNSFLLSIFLYLKFQKK